MLKILRKSESSNPISEAVKKVNELQKKREDLENLVMENEREEFSAKRNDLDNLGMKNEREKFSAKVLIFRGIKYNPILLETISKDTINDPIFLDIFFEKQYDGSFEMNLEAAKFLLKNPEFELTEEFLQKMCKSRLSRYESFDILQLIELLSESYLKSRPELKNDVGRMLSNLNIKYKIMVELALLQNDLTISAKEDLFKSFKDNDITSIAEVREKCKEILNNKELLENIKPLKTLKPLIESLNEFIYNYESKKENVCFLEIAKQDSNILMNISEEFENYIVRFKSTPYTGDDPIIYDEVSKTLAMVTVEVVKECDLDMSNQQSPNFINDVKSKCKLGFKTNHSLPYSIPKIKVIINGVPLDENIIEQLTVEGIISDVSLGNMPTISYKTVNIYVNRLRDEILLPCLKVHEESPSPSPYIASGTVDALAKSRN